MSGILVAIDFEKAFDSLDHTYLLKVLHAFNFGPFLSNGSVLFTQIYQVASLIIALHQLISPLVGCAAARPIITSSLHIRIGNACMQYSTK